MRATILTMSLSVVLAACSAAEAEKPTMTREQRKAANEERVKKAVPARAYSYDVGELVIMQPETVNSTGYLDRHQCFVWRDKLNNTSSLSCVIQPDPVPRD